MTNDLNIIKSTRTRINALVAVGPSVQDESYAPIVNEAVQHYRNYSMVPLEIFRAIVIVLLLICILAVFVLRMTLEDTY